MGGASAVGALFKVAGTVNKTMQANAELARNEIELNRQSALAEGQAADSVGLGGVLAGLAREKGAQLLAKQKVAYSAAGVDAGVGTAADVGVEAAMLSEHDANVITANAAREAWGYKESAINLATKARATRGQAQDNAVGGVLSSVSSVLGAVGGGIGGD